MKIMTDPSLALMTSWITGLPQWISNVYRRYKYLRSIHWARDMAIWWAFKTPNGFKLIRPIK